MKVAIYCRLSDEDRDKISATDDSASIQNQKSMLITYAINRGWEIYSIYSDDDYSVCKRMKSTKVYMSESQRKSLFIPIRFLKSIFPLCLCRIICDMRPPEGETHSRHPLKLSQQRKPHRPPQRTNNKKDPMRVLFIYEEIL